MFAQVRMKGEQVDGRIAAHAVACDVLEKEKRAAETRQAAIEESQPEERKRLAKIKEEVIALMDARSKIQKDIGRIEAQIEMAKRSVASTVAHDGAGNRTVEDLVAVNSAITVVSALNVLPLFKRPVPALISPAPEN